MPLAEKRSPATLYFDHGATSWPKPDVVVEAVRHSLTSLGGSPGRGAHKMALQVSRTVFESRKSCASYLGVSDSRNLIFVPGCTAGCNMMLFGLLESGDRVVVGSMEHNAITRPLAKLADAGVEVVKVSADVTGWMDPSDIKRAIESGQSETKAVVCQHASNVTGAIQPVSEIASVAHSHGALMLVDGAQGIGHFEIDLSTLGADVYAASGHKGLLGPQGIGLLYIAPETAMRVRDSGGTGGARSDSTEMPQERPDRYEAGTPNVPGIVGLGAAVGFLEENGERIHAEERRLTELLMEGLGSLNGVSVYGPPLEVERIPIVSVTSDRLDGATIASRLDREFDIACRAGLHCAPEAHRSIGTIETGTVRFGIGWSNTAEDVSRLIEALVVILR